MKINSKKYTENEIYTSMIKLFKDEELSKIVINDNILRLRYGGIKKEKINFNRQKAEKIILLYLKNKDFKYNLDLVYTEYWNDLVNYKEELKTTDQAEEIYSEHFVEKYNPLVLCAMLWNTEIEELNKFADKIYGEEIKGKEAILRDIICEDIDDEYEKKEETISGKSDENIPAAVGDEKIKEYEDKIKEYEKILNKKDKIIEQMADKINKNDEAKAMKKEMKNLTREVLEMSKLVSDNLSKANKAIFDLEKRNAEILKELSRQSKALEKVNKKIDSNEQVNVINGIKSYVKLSMKQEREEMLFAFSKLLDDKLNKNCYMDSDDLGQKLVSDFSDSNNESNNEKIKKVDNINNSNNNDSSGIFDEDVEAMFNGLNLD